jgi:predicted TIM-barrel fold metal-dependent hydrolase
MKAIDVHAHFSTEKGEQLKELALKEAHQKYYKAEETFKTEKEMAQDFIDADVLGIIIGWDAEAATGQPGMPNDYVADMIKKFPKAFIQGWACVDPWKGKMAIQEAERAIKNLGLMGIKFQQVAQAFFPNDRRFYPLYETICALKAPVLFHTGYTGWGTGVPGGGGYKLKYVKPIPYIDDVAADFPNLTIQCAHPSWPWQEEMIAVALHKTNVYMDLSGWRPRYWPEALKYEIGRRLQDKLMMGSEYPLFSHKLWFEEFEQMGYKSEVIEKVYYKNAQRIYNLKV